VLGATVVTLAQLAYLPTLIVWAIAFIAGPGFAVGVDTAVSPAGTQLGLTPGVPVLGALPESATTWLLLLALLPVAVGGLAGWIARSRLVSSAVSVGAEPRSRLGLAEAGPAARPIDGSASARDSALAALLASDRSSVTPTALRDDAPSPVARSDGATADPIGPRFVIALGIAVLSAAGAALLAQLASGSIGPGRLAEVGPQPGAVALTVGLEVLLGAGILLLSPHRRPKPAPAAEPEPDAATPAPDAAPAWAQLDAGYGADEPESSTPPAPTKSWVERGAGTDPAPDPGPDGDPDPDPDLDPDPDGTPTVDLGPRRPAPRPPID
ncbi:MAG TPA: DUF6350 family protein, partial [Microbacterium sp.]|nr:DUF6350 family protein [Microbacterium sp.]